MSSSHAEGSSPIARHNSKMRSLSLLDISWGCTSGNISQSHSLYGLLAALPMKTRCSGVLEPWFRPPSHTLLPLLLLLAFSSLLSAISAVSLLTPRTLSARSGFCWWHRWGHAQESLVLCRQVAGSGVQRGVPQPEAAGCTTPDKLLSYQDLQQKAELLRC